MAEVSKISWTDSTFNIVWGCEKVSPGCANCYAAALAVDPRMGYRDRSGKFIKLWGAGSTRRVMAEGYWKQLAKWNRKAQEAGKMRLVFSSSQADFFESHPIVDEQRERFWNATRSLEWLQFQLVTKRPQNIREMLPPWWSEVAGRCWLGTSIESQAYLDRAEFILRVPSAVKFVSYEPALGALQFAPGMLGSLDDDSRIGWVIYGGESGDGYRSDADAWPEMMARQTRAANTALWMKQRAARIPGQRAEVFGHKIQLFPRPVGVLPQFLDERFSVGWSQMPAF